MSALRQAIRRSPALEEPERRRLLALDDELLGRLADEWGHLRPPSPAQVHGALVGTPITFDAVKSFRKVFMSVGNGSIGQ